LRPQACEAGNNPGAGFDSGLLRPLRGLAMMDSLESRKPIQASVENNVLCFLNEQIPFWKVGGKISLSYLGETYTLNPYFPSLLASHKKAKNSILNAPMTGKVVLILVSEGEEVKEGQSLLILEAMKMEHMISAPRKGKIKHIFTM